MASAASIKPLSEFTKTQHSSVTDDISPKNFKLPKPYAVCIVGASRGIGEEIAYAFAHAGATALVLAARSTSALQTVANKARSINPDCNVQVADCDVTSPTSVGDLASKVSSTVGRLDLVVMNSGYSGDVVLDVTKTPLDSAKRASDVNYLGTFYVAHHFIPLLMDSENGAKNFIVVGTLGTALVNGPVANTQYSVSKLAQNKLIEHVHEQFKDRGLLTLCIHPGLVLTQMARESKGAEEYIKYQPTDDVDLCGAFCVWIVNKADRVDWLGGRLLCATWDVKELEQRKEEIIERDLFKFYAQA